MSIFFKLPHHGSIRNIDVDFFRQITADTWRVMRRWFSAAVRSVAAVPLALVKAAGRAGRLFAGQRLALRAANGFPGPDGIRLE